MILQRDLWSFDPDAVTISRHALARYNDRRETNEAAARRGVMRLLTKATYKPLPPLTFKCGRKQRLMLVSGFVLVFSADMSTLITLWKQGDPRGGRAK